MNNASPARAKIENMYPLSPMQQGLLFHTLLAPRAGLYLPHVVLELSGELDAAALRQAWQSALQEHGVLRTGFFWEERDEPFQVVFRSAELHWLEQDWREDNPSQQSARLETFLATSRQHPFDLRKPPLIRLSLLRRDEQRYTLVFAYHHLILDGWSAARVLEHVFARVIAQAENLPLVNSPARRPFADYIAWLKQQDAADTEAFWRQHVQPPDARTSLPFATPGNPAAAQQDGQQELVLTPDETQQLRDFASRQQVTVNTLLQGAFALLLSRYNRDDKVLFGSTVAGRPAALPGATEMIGLLINSLPVQVSVPPTAKVGDWLRGIQQRQAAAVDHEHVALRDLQHWLHDGLSLFDCLFVFESYPVPDSLSGTAARLQLIDVRFDEQTHFPLTLQVAEGDLLRVVTKYKPTHLAADDIDRTLAHLHRLLLDLCDNGEALLHSLSPLSVAEQKQLAAWNHTQAPLPNYETLTDWLEQQASDTPAATAIEFAAQQLSYRQLHEQANRLAHRLREFGAGPEDTVAVHLQRSPTLVVALLAILKTGAAYLPLDPEQPATRLATILSDGAPRLLLFDGSAGLERLTTTGHTLAVDLDNENMFSGPPQAPTRRVHGDNALYVIYTSGSTGKPKGVINTHRALLNRLAWMQEAYALTAADRVLHKTPLGFDVSVWELFWPLLTGATLVIAEPGKHRDGAYLASLIQDKQITTAHFVPPMLAALLDNDDASRCSSLQRVICSGEILPATLQDRFFATLPKSELHNLYGPTEAAIDVTAWRCRGGAPTVPIGFPIHNTTIHLLDHHLDEVPVGIPGELYIGGAGLARGYCNDVAKTASAFLPNPFASDAEASPLLYRTGDLARRGPDGVIEFLGRVDNQVKLHGVRIEPGEIETAISAHDDVAETVVDLRSSGSGEPLLVAYVVAANQHAASLGAMETSDWQAFLEDKLPAVMVPQAFVVMDSLPLTVNGKVDRRRLPSPAVKRAGEYLAPRNPTEELVAATWSEVLKVEEIGAHDDFLALGGHSLDATRVNIRLRKQLNINLSLNAHFRYLTVSTLANHIDALQVSSAMVGGDVDTDKTFVEIEL